ncbi:MAG: 1-acyl-sn-glycerol-3-phosphate acyltransferase [Clostridiales bacterium]|nr:1-acyl-sn-glycerol-3-phosphate acyltransferase [Clostridiales bacterium]
MLYLFIYLFKPLIYLVFRPKVYGNKKALRTKGKVIFICNHIHMLDPILIALVSPRIVHFMAKKELFKSKLGNLFFKLSYVFPVDRGTADLKSLKQALALLDKGKAFGIFPEGRRMVADRMDEFELGTSFIAMRSGAPVVPIYIANDAYRSFRFRMIVGEPIYAADSAMNVSRRENEVIFMQRMRNEMNSLKRELEEKCS